MMNNMGLLDRLNVFKRVKNLEIQETQLLDSISLLQHKAQQLDVKAGEMETAVEEILDYVDKRAVALNVLNRKILNFTTSESGSLDMIPDLDLEVR